MNTGFRGEKQINISRWNGPFGVNEASSRQLFFRSAGVSDRETYRVLSSTLQVANYAFHSDEEIILVA